MTARRLRWLAAVVGMLASAGVWFGVLMGPSVASASVGQVSIMQDANRVLADPVRTLATFRALGARMVRVVVVWAQIAPDSTFRAPPPGFDAGDPAAYPAANWAPYDAVVRAASADGIAVDFTLSGGAPRWAEGPGIPRAALDNPFWAWRPSARDFGQFAHAVGERYSGSYVPPGQNGPLPRVSFWAIWNEPNFGEDLGPQAIKGSSVSVAPMMYRSLVGQAWKALHATGHGADAVLIGEFAPMGLSSGPAPGRPMGWPGEFGQTKPLRFLRTLYCVDSNYRPLRGSAARSVGCPASAAASRGFRKNNPALFEATGLADHPYSWQLPPTVERSRDPDIAPFPRLPNLERAIDRVQQVYGSHRRLAIYDTEYGYITRPPNRGRYPSPATAAYYLNWAEYLSWKQPRVASTMQYMLYDPPLGTVHPGDGGFSSGLLFSNGREKPGYAAYRLPLYLPVVSTRRGHRLVVWGCVRPAHYAMLDGGTPQVARIEFARARTRAYRTLSTVRVATASSCYFDVRLSFPSSGTVRLAYTYPPGWIGLAGTTVYSRSVAIKVR